MFRTLSLSFFPIFAGSCDGLLHTVALELSLLVDAECSASCNTDDGDAGVDELQELLEKPGTTIGKKFAVFALYSSAIFDDLWLLASGPLEGIPVVLQSFPSERTAGVSSRSFTVTKKSNSLIYTVASSFVCTSPLALIMVDGLSKTLTVSIRQSSGLSGSTCAFEDPESTTNSLSSGFMTDGTRRLHSLAGEKKVALSATLSFGILGQSPRVSASTSAPVFRSPPETYPQISWRTDCADEEL